MLRGSVVDLLNDAQSVNVVACAESQDQVLPLAEAYRSQLAILDLDINRENRAELIGRLLVNGSQPCVPDSLPPLERAHRDIGVTRVQRQQHAHLPPG